MVLQMVSRIVTSTAGLYSPCILLLQSIHAIGRDRDARLMVSRIVTSTAGLYSPCILLLQSIHAIGRDRDGSSDGK